MASVLTNGKVLVAGGADDSNVFNTAELYDPSTGVWTNINNMAYARHLHTACVLTNAKVLVTGGWNSGGYLNSSELYQP
jgi:N-acetylneuraminic acid mutarotase